MRQDFSSRLLINNAGSDSVLRFTLKSEQSLLERAAATLFYRNEAGLRPPEDQIADVTLAKLPTEKLIIKAITRHQSFVVSKGIGILLPTIACCSP